MNLKTKVSYTLILFFLALPVNGESGDDEERTSSSGKPVKSFQTASAAWREKKIASSLGEPAGLMFIPGALPLFSSGVRTLFYFDRDTALEMSLAYGSSILYERRTRQYLADINYRAFMGNSFYLTGGLTYREYQLRGITGDVIAGTHDKKSFYRFRSDSLGVNFGLGNQWQFSTFTIGCEWFQIGLPVAQLSLEDQTEKESLISDDEKKAARNDFRSTRRQVHYGLVKFYLGFSF